MGGTEMKHLGDITKINGAEIEIVDVITGGSPCQDLSIAGKRAGLLTASAAFHWCSNGTTARARHAGQARSRNFLLP
nr:MAG TPA: Cytosine specific methyltransferase [Caudoviricetes sp.]